MILDVYGGSSKKFLGSNVLRECMMTDDGSNVLQKNIQMVEGRVDKK